jgi:hypothetical protein
MRAGPLISIPTQEIGIIAGDVAVDACQDGGSLSPDEKRAHNRFPRNIPLSVSTSTVSISAYCWYTIGWSQ